MGGIDGGNIVRHQVYGSNSVFKPHPKTKTNADRIRASIEDNKELAELTIRRKSVFRRTKGYTETVYVCSDGSVTDDWGIAFNREMEWLRQPAEEE